MTKTRWLCITLVAFAGAAMARPAVAQEAPDRRWLPRLSPRVETLDTTAFRRVPLDSLRHLLVPRRSTSRSELTCPMPVSRPDSLSTVPIPRARLPPNSAVPIPVDRTSCRNPL
jgi:hypothetical protein